MGKKYEYKDLEEIQAVHDDLLLDKANVVAMGIGCRKGGEDDDLAFKVFVSKKVPTSHLEDKDIIPRTIEGVPVEVEMMDTPEVHRTGRYRPANPGVSVGHYEVTAGTFGAVGEYKDKKGTLILSNNHVLANSNNSKLGDDVLQPGKYDGGTPEKDVIAKLDSYVPLKFKWGEASGATARLREVEDDFDSELKLQKRRIDTYFKKKLEEDGEEGGYNEVDAAAAKVIDAKDVDAEILEIGKITGIEEAKPRMKVMKSGRTTGLTRGTIKTVNTTVDVGYGFYTNARFKGQIVTDDMSKAGDSGSLLVKDPEGAEGEGHKATAFLFAGSSDSTIFNPINKYLKQLDRKLRLSV